MPPASEATPLLSCRWVRIAAGLALVVLCAAVAVAAWALPFVEIRAGTRRFALDGPTQTANLHLVLVATGVLGALLGLYYAVSRATLRYAFFVVGSIAAVFTGLLWLGSYHVVRYAEIVDPRIYAAVKSQDVVMAVGSALWVSGVATVGILALAVLVWRIGAHAPAPPAPPTRRL